MPRSRPFVLGLLLSAGLMATASTAEAKIVVGQSIDGIKLGDTQAHVEQVLGPPAYKYEANGGSSWGYPTTLLGRVGLDSTHHVNAIWTASKRQKTSQGIGPGSSLAQVRKAYPKVKCSTGPFGPKSLICTLKSKYNGRAVETAFPFFTRSMGAREVDMNYA
jgi:hypothetical protein